MDNTMCTFQKYTSFSFKQRLNEYRGKYHNNNITEKYDVHN